MRVNPNLPYRWNEAAGRYISSTGRFVPLSTVKAELESMITASAVKMDMLSLGLKNGTTSLAEWQMGMEQEIKASQIASAAAAKGGWAQMTQSDWGWVGSRVKEQYKYLRNFSAEIASGKQKIDGRLLVRAKQYIQSSRATYEEMRRRYARINKGAVEERRVLGPAEHCEPHGSTPGCVELADKGWQPMGTLPAIGAATCRMFCKCHFEMRDASGKVL